MLIDHKKMNGSLILNYFYIQIRFILHGSLLQVTSKTILVSAVAIKYQVMHNWVGLSTMLFCTVGLCVLVYIMLCLLFRTNLRTQKSS